MSGFSFYYSILGDPFRVNIPIDKIDSSGETNTIELKIANSSRLIDDVNASDSDKVIYTLLLLSNYSYSNITERAEGCIWDIEYQEGGMPEPLIVENIRIPETYTGTNECFYNSDYTTGTPHRCVSTIPDDHLVENDAIVQATYLLLKNQLDKNPDDCILDLDIDKYHVSSMLLPSVPFLKYVKADVLSWR